MSAKKHLPGDTIDPSLHPTRKVESMTSLAAELLLREHDAAQERGAVFDDRSGRRLRMERLPAFDAYPDPPLWQSQAWRATTPTPPPSLASQPLPPSRTGARIALLVAGALILVALSVTMTLLLSR